MEPSSDAPHSQAEPAVQAESVATPTPTNAEALPPKPNDKTKVKNWLHIVWYPQVRFQKLLHPVWYPDCRIVLKQI